jgi:replicative DNA helicase
MATPPLRLVHDQVVRFSDVAVEMAMLALLLDNNRALTKVEHLLKPEHFSCAVYGRIYAAIQRITADGSIANALTLRGEFDVDSEFADKPEGSAPYLATITASIVTRHNPEDYAERIADLWQRRTLAARAEDFLTTLKQDPTTPTDKLVAKYNATVASIALDVTGTAQTKHEVIEHLIDAILSPPPRYSCGMPQVDEAMGGGFYAGKLYGLGARKKAGKTMLLSTWSYDLNMAGIPHLFIGAEMSPIEIEHRMAARWLKINPIAFLRHPTKDLARRTAEYHSHVPNNMIYEHRPTLTLDDLAHMINRAIARAGIKGVLLDYWQLVRGRQRDDTQEQHQANVAQFLADVARRENIFVVVAAQLNQEGNSRGGEGLRLSADLYWVLSRELGATGGVLTMEDARYVPYRDIGTTLVPGIHLHNGSHFSEDPVPLTNDGGGDLL